MARIVNNVKGFKVIAMNSDEADSIGFGIFGNCLCMECNEYIKNTIYYIAVLNDCMDKDCYEKWLKDAVHYKEDEEFENKYFNCYKKLLNL